MRFTDYKNRILDFLAESFRRLAEFLNVKTEEKAKPQTHSSAPADWLEKTRGISAEQWFDFSAENSFEQAEKENAETTGELSFQKPKPIFENETAKDETERKIETRNASGKILNEKKSSVKNRRPQFLRFNLSDEERVREDGEKIETMKNLPADESDKTVVSPNQKPKMIFSSISEPEEKNESAKAVKNTNKNAFEVRSAEPRSHFIKTENQQTENAEKIEQTKQTMKIDITKIENAETDFSRKSPESSFRRSFSPKGFFTREPADFQTKEPPQIYRKVKTESKKVFAFDNETGNESVRHFPIEKTEIIKAEKTKNHRKRGAGKTGAEKIFAAPPWIDLPESDREYEFEKIEENFGKTEHLLYLEHEQTGSKEKNN